MEHSFSLRKMMAVLLVAVLAFGVLWMPSSAKAAGDNMEMTVEFSPTSLSSSGEVKVRAVVSNRGDDVSNVTVTVGDKQVASWSSFIVLCVLMFLRITEMTTQKISPICMMKKKISGD